MTNMLLVEAVMRDWDLTVSQLLGLKPENLNELIEDAEKTHKKDMPKRVVATKSEKKDGEMGA